MDGSWRLHIRRPTYNWIDFKQNKLERFFWTTNLKKSWPVIRASCRIEHQIDQVIGFYTESLPVNLIHHGCEDKGRDSTEYKRFIAQLSEAEGVKPFDLFIE